MMNAKLIALLRKEQELTESLDNVRGLIAAEQAAPAWPQVDDVYWLIASNGRVECIRWDGGEYDTRIAQAGNLYRTQAEAVQVARRRHVYAEMRSYSTEPETGAYVIKWRDGEWVVAMPAQAVEPVAVPFPAIRFANYEEAERASLNCDLEAFE